MINKPIAPYNTNLPVHIPPPLADQITKLSYQPHKNPLNTQQQQARKDA